jgi:hypothetical protein
MAIGDDAQHPYELLWFLGNYTGILKILISTVASSDDDAHVEDDLYEE